MPLPASFADRPPVPAADPLPSPIIDAHTHLDACGADEPAAVRAALDAATAVGVRAVITVGDRLASARWAAAAAQWDDRLYAAVAVHPTRADELDEAARAELAALARQDRVVAVGETGLDNHWPARGVGAAPALQREAFAWHIQLAKDVGKTLMIHDREAHDEILQILDTEGAPERVAFHCFSGDVALARQCADRGFVMSFAGPVTFRNNHELHAAARFAPADLITVETDAPYLAPHPYRGSTNSPAAVAHTARAMAALRDVELTDFCRQLCATTARLYEVPTAG